MTQKFLKIAILGSVFSCSGLPKGSPFLIWISVINGCVLGGEVSFLTVCRENLRLSESVLPQDPRLL